MLQAPIALKKYISMLSVCLKQTALIKNENTAPIERISNILHPEISKKFHLILVGMHKR